MTEFYKNILQLILSPSKGWEDVDGSDSEPQHLITQCMNPLFALAALSVFLQMAFRPDLQISMMFIKACVVFVSFFVTYFFASAMGKKYIERNDADDQAYEKCTTVIVYGLSLLALATLVCNLLPLTVGLSYIMPLAVALVLWKANNYLKIGKEGDTGFVVYVVLSIVIPPTLIQSMFEYVLQ